MKICLLAHAQIDGRFLSINELCWINYLEPFKRTTDQNELQQFSDDKVAVIKCFEMLPCFHSRISHTKSWKTFTHSTSHQLICIQQLVLLCVCMCIRLMPFVYCSQLSISLWHSHCVCLPPLRRRTTYAYSCVQCTLCTYVNKILHIEKL